MRKILALLSVLLATTSCVDKSLYKYDPENPTKPGQTNDRTFYENVDFAAAFATHHTLTVKKTTTSIMSIYYAYPYKNGADGEQILRDADAVFYSAGEYTLEVPNHVKSIYYWNGRSFTQKSIDGLTSVTLPDGSRSVAELDANPEVISRINEFFPEKAMARNKEEIQKCCDLEIKPREGETLESVTLTLTYIGDGGGGVAGNLFIYTYPASKRKTLTLSDVTFYELTGGPLKVTEDDSRTSYTLTTFQISDKKNLESRRNCSIFRQENNVKANWGDGNSQKIKKRDVQITHENFKEGINLGFCFLGTNSVAGFSTPELNDPIEKDIRLSAAGGFVDFNAGELQSRCLVYHTTVGDTEFNILGCENRNVQDSSYDGDYNDMLVMISSDPSYIKPVDVLDNPVEDDISVTEGFWLFEDIYPEVENNDFDYNDVVVQYTIIKNETKKTFKVLSQLVAKGCSQGNVFGLDCGNQEKVVFSGVSGYKNVYAEESGNVSAPLEIKEVEFSYSSSSAKIEPWLMPNGKDKLKPGTYCEGMKYPYVLDIRDWNFPGWAIERTHIIEAYQSFPTGTWYKNPKAGNYIKR